MKLIGMIMLATMIAPIKGAEIETVTGGVFYVEAWDCQAGLLVKGVKEKKVMFNMEHILYAEEKGKTTIITVEDGNNTRQFLIKMKFDDAMKGIVSTYHKGGN
jgi:hypothetical protein|tara:strand:- start:635 stop:943 length:309 start_codon:yes stop_codon:yes gene_type:complete